MGQPITITGTTVQGAIAAFHCDRSITGQDGVGFSTVDDARRDGTFPGDLAVRLFEADDSVDHVYLASNQVVVRRQGDWDDDALRGAAAIVETFFVFYADA